MMISSGAASFAVKDIGEAAAFYRDLLGLRVADQPLGVPGANVPVGLRIDLPGGSLVQVYPKPDHQPATFTVLNLLVPDIDAAVDELTAKGVRFEQYDQPRTDERGIHRDPAVNPVAWLRDPSGNIVALIEAAAPR
jgi:catechol 2,3-dioxygenase-like lactoylglutathione lyase family enzyme